jgi:hypothetical protein
MKTSRFPLSGRLVALSLVLSAGCSKENQPTSTAGNSSAQPPAPATQAPAALTPAPSMPATDPIAEMKTALTEATLEKHDGLAAIQQRMDQEIDAQVAAKKAAATVNLAADEKLDAATEDFAEKLRMLTVARPETWSTAKNAAELALQNVRAAHAEVIGAQPER